ncbi:hypothetical protein LCGC14_2220660, partial [marine sediment metagenome]
MQQLALADALHRERMKEYRRRYRRRHPDRVNEANRRTWNGFAPERRQAYQAVRNALRRGEIKQEPCEVCGDKNSHAHHDNYTRPLEIVWFCRIHHAERHGVPSPTDRTSLRARPLDAA